MSRRFLKGFLGAFLFLFALFLLVPLCVQLSVASATFTTTDDVPAKDVAIVLGASVYGDSPSPILAKRADLAATLFQKGKVTKILVSGDDSPYHDEVSAAENYLIESGIPKAAIMLDREGFDTYQSMYRARTVFGVRSAIISTQGFHMPRALFLAKAEGIDVVGAVAQGGETPLFSYAREIPATWKALYDLIREHLARR